MKIILQVPLFLVMLISCTLSDKSKPIFNQNPTIVGETSDSTDPWFLNLFEEIDLDTFLNENPEFKKGPNTNPNRPKLQEWQKPNDFSVILGSFAKTILENNLYDDSYKRYFPRIDLFYDSNFSLDQFNDARDCLKAAEEAMLFAAYHIGQKDMAFEGGNGLPSVNNGNLFNMIQFVYTNGYTVDADFEGLLFDPTNDFPWFFCTSEVDTKVTKDIIADLMREAISQKNKAIGKFFPTEAYSFRQYIKAKNKSLNEAFFKVKKEIEGNYWHRVHNLVQRETIKRIEIAKDKLATYKEKYAGTIEKRRSLAYERSMKLLRNHVTDIALDLGHNRIENLEGTEYLDMLKKSVLAHLSRIGMDSKSPDLGEQMEILLDVFSLSLIKQVNVIREQLQNLADNNPVRTSLSFEDTPETDSDLILFFN